MTSRAIGVLVKYIPPTNYRGTRFSVRVATGYRNQHKPKLYSYDYSLTLDENMRSVAIEHAKASGICAITCGQKIDISADTTLVLLEV